MMILSCFDGQFSIVDHFEMLAAICEHLFMSYICLKLVIVILFNSLILEKTWIDIKMCLFVVSITNLWWFLVILIAN